MLNMDNMNTIKSQIISDNITLREIMQHMKQSAFVAIDTEFMRDSTYYPKLCLIQMASPDKAVCIDPLADIDMSIILELLHDEKVTKIFHAGRQDIEIFVHLSGQVPRAIYDTQIAAMVCGLGDQVGYDKLVKHFEGTILDKSSRYSDWSARPLSARQVAYALDDVIYLARLFPKIQKKLHKTGREKWVESEMRQITDKSLYVADPATAYKRIKTGFLRPEQMNRLAELAKWREKEAQKKNLPKPRIMRDEILTMLALHPPKNIEGCGKIRGFPGGKSGKLAGPVLETLKKAAQIPREQWPQIDPLERNKKPPAAVSELLRVLLKHICAQHQVAPKLVASAHDLDALALGDGASVPALHGWRFDIFGQYALALKAGELKLWIKNGQLHIEKTL